MIKVLEALYTFLTLYPAIFFSFSHLIPALFSASHPFFHISHSSLFISLSALFLVAAFSPFLPASLSPHTLSLWINGSTVAQWLPLLPHSMEVLGCSPRHPRSFPCGVCMFSLCLHVFLPGVPVPPTIKDMYVAVNTAVNAHDQGTSKKN